PVPGDLRINWRVALILAMLGGSRARRASLAKLHVLNYAARSARARLVLDRVLSGDEPALNWHMRVEPAFGRALDFVVGEQFAGWTKVRQRAGLQLTEAGITAWQRINEQTDVLVEEKEFLQNFGRRITEGFVVNLLHTRRRDG